MYDPQQLNRYAYTRNNPYKYTDPDGNIPVPAITAAAFAGIFGVGEIYRQIVQYGEVRDWNAVGAMTAGGAMFGVKSHAFPLPGNDRIIGSVVLNNHVGGLNADAVAACAAASSRPIVVWFPTISAENHLNKSEYEIRPEWGARISRRSEDVAGIRVEKDGALTESACCVLRTILDCGAILATGHLSWQESRVVVREAVGRGIKKIVITHPIYQLIDMPIDVQKELARYAYIEHTYSMVSIDRLPVEKIAEQMNAVGPNRCIMTSDVGQPFSPSPAEALRRFADLLKQQGIADADISTMLVKNPRRLAT